MTKSQNDIESGLQKIERFFTELQSFAHGAAAEPLLKLHNELLLAVEELSHWAALMSQVHPDEVIRTRAEETEQRLATLVTTISLSRDLYDVFLSADTTSLDPVALRLYKKIMDDFLRSGVNTDEPTRVRIKSLQEELVKKGQEYSRNVRADVRTVVLAKEILAGLPEDFIAAHPPNTDGFVTITTDYPDYFPFMEYCTSEVARQELFIAFHQRGYPENIQILHDVLGLRHELAALLGFENWAAYVTADKMIKTHTAADQFITEVAAYAADRAKNEYQILLGEKQREQPNATELHAWDRAFYENIYKKRVFAFDSLSLRPYFSYEAVESGLLRIVSTLYGVEFVAEPDAHVWHESVHVFLVKRNGTPIGRIYLDMHPRENKYKHAAQFPIRSGISNAQLPEGALVCNMGTDLIDQEQVVTMFHEFGHLMHHIFGGAVSWQYFSGVATEWDFVEAPSQLFEEWARTYETLATFAHHHITDERIPQEMVQRMRQADDWGTGLFVRRQMALASVSLKLHIDPPKSTAALEERIAEIMGTINTFPYADGMQLGANFEHLIGYTALYYTYMWSLVIAKDLLSGFDHQNLLDAETAQRYMQTILSAGGSVDAATLIETFLGRPYSFDAFRAWLATGELSSS